MGDDDDEKAMYMERKKNGKRKAIILFPLFCLVVLLAVQLRHMPGRSKNKIPTKK